jgi:hypothetical protein
MALHGIFMLLYMALFGFVLYLMNAFHVAFPRSVNAFDFFLLCLATFRITELITCDTITQFMRDPFVKREKVREPDGSVEEEVQPAGRGFRRFIGELIICPWCIGIWVGTLLAYFFVLLPGPARLFLLAVSAAAGGIIIQLFAKMLDQITDRLK